MSDTPTDWTDDPIVALVTADLFPALAATFEPVAKFPFSPAEGLPNVIEGSDGTAVVAWEYRGKERLNPLVPRDFPERVVIVRGITVVVNPKKDPRFHRYIDWAGVYDQLGMMPGRPSTGDTVTVTVGRDDDHLTLVAPDHS